VSSRGTENFLIVLLHILIDFKMEKNQTLKPKMEAAFKMAEKLISLPQNLKYIYFFFYKFKLQLIIILTWKIWHFSKNKKANLFKMVEIWSKI
jgi:hypothetical protein